jgi:anti-sigma regulatory factor (Ser/Thr protein kinase)
MTGSAHLDLPETQESPRSARRFVTDQLSGWGYGSIAPDAGLLTSELVTNAVRHSSAPYALDVVDLDDGVLVTVRDAGQELPLPRYPGPEAVRGRGLAIVEAVAAAWGAWPIPDDGKFVWFRLAGDQS